jgi:hypothetical protein
VAFATANQKSWERFRRDAREDPARTTLEVTLVDDPSPIIARVGLDGVYRISPGDDGLPQDARGAWADKQTFVIDDTTIANDDAYFLRLQFEDNGMTQALMDRTRGATVGLDGTAAAR